MRFPKFSHFPSFSRFSDTLKMTLKRSSCFLRFKSTFSFDAIVNGGEKRESLSRFSNVKNLFHCATYRKISKHFNGKLLVVIAIFSELCCLLFVVIVVPWWMKGRRLCDKSLWSTGNNKNLFLLLKKYLWGHWLVEPSRELSRVRLFGKHD